MRMPLLVLTLIIALTTCKSSNVDPKSDDSKNSFNSKELLIFNDSRGIVYFLNTEDGKEINRMQLDAEYLGSLTIDSKIGYLPGNKHNGLVAFSLADGTPIWKQPTLSDNYLTPVIVDSILIVGHEHKLVGINKKTGKTLWEVIDPYFGHFSEISTLSGDVYAATLYDINSSGRLYSVNAQSGKINWVNENGLGASANSIPFITKDLVVVSTFGWPSQILAFKINDGNKVWEYEPNYRDNKITLTKISNEIVVCSSEGVVYALDSSTGKESWRHYTGHNASWRIVSQENTLIYMTNSGILYSFDTDRKKVNWSFDTYEDEISSIPTIYNNSIFITTLSGKIFNLDIKTGKQNWAYYCENPIWSSPSVLTNEGKVYRGYGNIGNP